MKIIFEKNIKYADCDQIERSIIVYYDNEEKRNTKCIIEFNDRKEYFINSKLHREDGPAIEFNSGKEEWYLNGKLHRENGPARILPNGFEAYYRNGKLHRENKPAIINPNGDFYYYINDELHNLNGPAEFRKFTNISGAVHIIINYYKNGKLHREDGPASITKDENGLVLEEKYYKNGVKV